MCSFSAADMDARSVMEQRLQAMVCCFSMVQRVLARQPQDDSTVVSASTSTTSSTSTSSTSSGCTTQSESSKKTGTSINTPYNIDCSTNNNSSNSSSGNSNNTLPECEQGFEGKLPTRTVSAAEATERIWKYLSAVPSLMEVRITCVHCAVDFCILMHVQVLTNI